MTRLASVFALVTLVSVCVALSAVGGTAWAAPCSGPEARGGAHFKIGFIFDEEKRPAKITLFGPGGHYQDVLPHDYADKIDICLPEQDCPDLQGCIFTFSATWEPGDASGTALEILVPVCIEDRCYEGQAFLGNVFVTRVQLDYAKLGSLVVDACNVTPFYPTEAVRSYLLCRAIFRDRQKLGLTWQIWAAQALRGWHDRAFNLVNRRFANNREMTVVVPLALDQEVRSLVESAFGYNTRQENTAQENTRQEPERNVPAKVAGHARVPLEAAGKTRCYYFDLMLELEASRAMTSYQLSRKLLARSEGESDSSTKAQVLNWARRSEEDARHRFSQVLVRDERVSKPDFGCHWQQQSYSPTRTWSGLNIGALDRLESDIAQAH